jgi:uncharacterized protein (DUF58 family)
MHRVPTVRVGGSCPGDQRNAQDFADPRPNLFPRLAEFLLDSIEADELHAGIVRLHRWLGRRLGRRRHSGPRGRLRRSRRLARSRRLKDGHLFELSLNRRAVEQADGRYAKRKSDTAKLHHVSLRANQRALHGATHRWGNSRTGRNGSRDGFPLPGECLPTACAPHRLDDGLKRSILALETHMPVRRRAWLSREGVYCVCVLAFIVGGAVLRSFNLLVILAGMMIALLLLNWRIVMATLRGLVVCRMLPEQVSAGEPLTVEIAVTNPRRRLGAWLVTIEDWVQRVDAAERGERPQSRGLSVARRWGTARNSWRLIASALKLDRTHAATLAAQIHARSTATTTYRVTIPRRGRYRFGPLRVSTRYPLGLVCGHFELAQYAELIVGPRIGRLLPAWAALLEAELAGDERRHPQRGLSEGDYYGLRPWQSGDSTRWIHWRTTAKLATPTVLQFERQRNRDVALLLDPWLPSHPQEHDQGALELAISLAATAVADLTGRGHARLVLGVAAGEPQIWSGPASPVFCEEIHRELATLEGADGSSLAETLKQVREQSPSGARLIVISPRGQQVATDSQNDNLCWIDVSDPGLPELFSLE